MIILLAICACGHKETTTEEEKTEVRTPVTVTGIERTSLNEFVELNATSTYLESNFIKASANGYIRAVNIKLGQQVQSGQQAFTIQTKEAAALGNTINKLDPSFHFSGMIPIRTHAAGFIQELNHQVGDYVQDGDQLAVVSDSKSFGFILNLPYELRQFVSTGKQLEVELPDGRKLNGVVSAMMQLIDSASQTQRVMIKIPAAANIPQNLIAKVRILKAQRNGAMSVPKEAVLTDEAQENFWVMKMIDSVTAVKITIIKGMETGDRVELVRPEFAAGDRILVSGNYGLPDTAKVIVQKAKE